MIFLAGANCTDFSNALLFLGAVVYVAMTKPYVIVRFSSYLNPWAAENVFGGSYQLTQALIAFGRANGLVLDWVIVYRSYISYLKPITTLF